MVIRIDHIVSADTALACVESFTDNQLASLTRHEANRITTVIDGEWIYLEAVVLEDFFDAPVDAAQVNELAAINDRIERCRMASARIERVVLRQGVPAA